MNGKNGWNFRKGLRVFSCENKRAGPETGSRRSRKCQPLTERNPPSGSGWGEFDFREILRIRPGGSLSHVQAPIGFDHPRDLAGSSRHPGIGTLPLIPRDSGAFQARQMRRHFPGAYGSNPPFLLPTASPAGLPCPRQMIFSPFFIDKKPHIMMKSGDCSAPAGTDSGRFPQEGEEVRPGYALPEDDIARFVPSGPVTGSLPGWPEKGTDVMHTAFIGGIENET